MAARMRGFDCSFLIFVVSSYALPVFIAWDVIVLKLFPFAKFEPVSSPFKRLVFKES